LFHFVVQSLPQEFHNQHLATTFPALQAQTKKISTHEREILVDSTKAETVHKSRNDAVNITIKAIPLPSSNETVRDFITGATSAQDKSVLTRDGLENTTAAFKKQDFSNDESVPEFNCKQLKNRTSVSELGFFARSRKSKTFFQHQIDEFILVIVCFSFFSSLYVLS